MTRVTEATTMLQWAAEAGSARSATWAGFRLCSLRTVMWFFAVVLVLLTIEFAVGFDDRYSATTRWSYSALWGATYALGATALLTVFILVRLLLVNRRLLKPGTVLEAIWTPDRVHLRRTGVELTVQLASVQNVRVHRKWVTFRVRETRGRTLLPRALCPDSELARIPG
jgi:hypothetical protein